MTDPFEQMVRDAARDDNTFKSFMRGNGLWGGHGVKVWEMVSVGYSYRETQDMLGASHEVFGHRWKERHGR
jgi:hypothetical protein